MEVGLRGVRNCVKAASRESFTLFSSVTTLWNSPCTTLAGETCSLMFKTIEDREMLTVENWPMPCSTLASERAVLLMSHSLGSPLVLLFLVVDTIAVRPFQNEVPPSSMALLHPMRLVARWQT